MDDHRPRLHRLVRRTILQVESLRQLEIELDSRTLERTMQRVFDRDVDLGPVECTVAGVEVPFSGIIFI
jgi:hypothetical protein